MWCNDQWAATVEVFELLRSIIVCNGPDGCKVLFGSYFTSATEHQWKSCHALKINQSMAALIKLMTKKGKTTTE